MEAQTFRVMARFGEDRKESILAIVLVRFFSGRETHRFFRSHKNPTYLKDHAKSCPLHSIGCQGTPRGTVISNTDWRSKLYTNCEILSVLVIHRTGDLKITTSSTHLKMCGML